MKPLVWTDEKGRRRSTLSTYLHAEARYQKLMRFYVPGRPLPSGAQQWADLMAQTTSYLEEGNR